MLSKMTFGNTVTDLRSDPKWGPLLFPKGPLGPMDERQLCVELSGFNRLQEGAYAIMRRYANVLVRQHGDKVLMTPVIEVIHAVDATIKRLNERLMVESALLEAAMKWAENRTATSEPEIDLMVAIWNLIGDQPGCTKQEALAELEEKRAALHNGSLT